VETPRDILIVDDDRQVRDVLRTAGEGGERVFPTVGQAVAAAVNTYDPKARTQNFRKALQLIADQAYWAPVYYYSEEYLVSREVEFAAPKDGMQRLFLVRWK